MSLLHEKIARDLVARHGLLFGDLERLPAALIEDIAEELQKAFDLGRMASDTFQCTKETPWDGRKGRVCHPDAREVGEQRDGWPGGDLIRMRCPHCKHEWEMELP